ncbi:Cyclin-dependent kinase 4 [Dinochytrium kinnereticum]|nr:Cyclin-dependent kinase 4 [Dinochytrium kinnereticum]
MEDGKIYLLNGYGPAPNPRFTLPFENIGVVDPVSLGYQEENYNDTYIFHTPTQTFTNLTNPTPTTPFPPARHGSICHLSPNNRTITLFGGAVTDFELLDDVWEFDLVTMEWGLSTSNSSRVKPSQRGFGAGVGVGEFLVVVGGILGGRESDPTVHFYNTISKEWSTTPPTTPLTLPEAQSYHPPNTFFGTLGTPPPLTEQQQPPTTILPTTPQPTTSTSTSPSTPTSRGLVIGASVGAAVALVGATIVLILHQQKKKREARDRVEVGKRAEELALRREVGVDGSVYRHGGGGSVGRLPTYREEGWEGGGGEGEGKGGEVRRGDEGVNIPAVMFRTPVRDDELVKGGGTLERVLRPVLVDFVDATPNAIIASRYKITDQPLSTPSSRFTVLPAEDMQSRQMVALKVYARRGGSEDPEAAFRREVALLRRLKHQNVVQLLGFHALEEADGSMVWVSVMQRCTENLAQFLERNPGLQDLVVRSFVKGICEGLSYLSDNAIIHTDLKPSNILLIDGIFVRLADFESARIAYKETVSTVSLAYASPEVATAYHRTLTTHTPTQVIAMHSIDMWSVGCVMFEMYAGRPVTAGMSESAMLEFLISREPIKIPQGMVGPGQARHLLGSLLARDPGVRKSARQVLVSGYLNAGQDTVEIAMSRGAIEEKIGRVEREVLRVGRGVLRVEEAQRVVKRILANDVEAMVPRIVAMVPSATGVRWDQIQWWGTDVFRLHLLCEWPGNDPEDDPSFYSLPSRSGKPSPEHTHYVGPHLTADPGYPIADPRKFARTIGPVLQAGMSIASAAIGAGSLAMGRIGPNPVGGAAAGGSLFASVGVRPLEYFERLSGMLEEVRGVDGWERVEAGRVEGQGIRELEAFLGREDPGRRFGGLEKCVDRDGSVLWLCEHHAHVVRRRFQR